MAKLFVGQVPAICSEEQLSAIFGQFGELTDISIMRDRATGRSKGSAWVVFKDAGAAEEAIATLHDKHSIPPQSNSLQIRHAGKATGPGMLQPGESVSPVLMPSPQSPPQQPPLTMPPMPQQTDQMMTQQHMQMQVPQSRYFGQPWQGQQQPQQQPQQQQQQQQPQQQQQQQQQPHQQLQQPMGLSAMPQIIPQVHQMGVDAQMSLSPPLTHQMMPPAPPMHSWQQQVDQNQHIVDAPPHIPPPPSMGMSDDEMKPKHDKKFPPCGGRKLFVGQLPKDMSRTDVQNMMSVHGTIEELHVMTDKKTGQGTGAAFVIFERREDAVRAILILNGNVTIPGMKCPLQVRFAEGELDKNQDGKLFVGQVPYSANEEDLKRLFGPFGSLSEVALVRKGGQSKGCGFVRFTDRRHAEDAIEALNGRHTMPGGHSPLTVRFADSEEEKRKRREDRQTQQMQSIFTQMQQPQQQQPVPQPRPMPQHHNPHHQNPGQHIVSPMMGLGLGGLGGLGSHGGFPNMMGVPMYSPVMTQ